MYPRHMFVQGPFISAHLAGKRSETAPISWSVGPPKKPNTLGYTEKTPEKKSPNKWWVIMVHPLIIQSKYGYKLRYHLKTKPMPTERPSYESNPDSGMAPFKGAAPWSIQGAANDGFRWESHGKAMVTITNNPWDWYINLQYQHLPQKWPSYVGKYAIHGFLGYRLWMT